MYKIIFLDTNFLWYIVDYKIDVFAELERICYFPYKIQILSGTIEELEKLKPKNYGIIKLLLKKIEIKKSEIKKVDDELTKLSEEGAIIATQDKELKDRLKGEVIVIRQKKYLELK